MAHSSDGASVAAEDSNHQPTSTSNLGLRKGHAASPSQHGQCHELPTSSTGQRDEANNSPIKPADTEYSPRLSTCDRTSIISSEVPDTAPEFIAQLWDRVSNTLTSEVKGIEAELNVHGIRFSSECVNMNFWNQDLCCPHSANNTPTGISAQAILGNYNKEKADLKKPENRLSLYLLHFPDSGVWTKQDSANEIKTFRQNLETPFNKIGDHRALLLATLFRPGKPASNPLRIMRPSHSPSPPLGNGEDDRDFGLWWNKGRLKKLEWFIPKSSLPKSNSSNPSRPTLNGQPDSGLQSGQAPAPKTQASGHPHTGKAAETNPWNVSPDCVFLVSGDAFSSNLDPLQKSVVPSFQGNGMYPFLSIQFIEGLDLNMLSESNNVKELVHFTALAVYNRWLLWNLVREDVAGNMNSDPPPQYIRHYALIITETEWALLKTVPKTANKWTQAEVSFLSRGTLAKRFSDLVEVLNDVHFWGMTAYTEGCKNDVKAFYKARGGDPSQATPHKYPSHPTAKPGAEEEELEEGAAVWKT